MMSVVIVRSLDLFGWTQRDFTITKNHRKNNHVSNWPGAFSLRGRKRWLRTDKKERERDKCGCLPLREREREREREVAWPGLKFPL